MNPFEPVEEKVPFYKNIYLQLFVLGAVMLTLLRPLLVREPPPPPVQGQLPVFALTNQKGETFGSDQLKGKVYIASFLFTQCTTVCPMLVKNLATLQKRFEDAHVDIPIVSFSVDPSTDTPAVLADYGTRAGANFDRWVFLTGPHDAMRKTLEGFALALEPKKVVNDLMDIAHSQRLVIVDGTGGLRGRYESSGEGLDEVFHRAQHVLHE